MRDMPACRLSGLNLILQPSSLIFHSSSERRDHDPKRFHGTGARSTGDRCDRWLTGLRGYGDQGRFAERAVRIREASILPQNLCLATAERMPLEAGVFLDPPRRTVTGNDSGRPRSHGPAIRTRIQGRRPFKSRSGRPVRTWMTPGRADSEVAVSQRSNGRLITFRPTEVRTGRPDLLFAAHIQAWLPAASPARTRIAVDSVRSRRRGTTPASARHMS